MPATRLKALLQGHVHICGASPLNKLLGTFAGPLEEECCPSLV